jgi:hypothetical protein
MDKETQEIFDTILAGDKETLNSEQLGFIMARRSYMNDEQRKRFKKEIDLHEEGKLIMGEEVSLGAMTMKELAAKAKTLKIKGITNMDKEALIEAIESVEEKE